MPHSEKDPGFKFWLLFVKNAFFYPCKDIFSQWILTVKSIYVGLIDISEGVLTWLSILCVLMLAWDALVFFPGCNFLI